MTFGLIFLLTEQNNCRKSIKKTPTGVLLVHMGLLPDPLAMFWSGFIAHHEYRGLTHIIRELYPNLGICFDTSKRIISETNYMCETNYMYEVLGEGSKMFRSPNLRS